MIVDEMVAVPAFQKDKAEAKEKADNGRYGRIHEEYDEEESNLSKDFGMEKWRWILKGVEKFPRLSALFLGQIRSDKATQKR